MLRKGCFIRACYSIGGAHQQTSRSHLSQWRKRGRQLGTKNKIAIISAYGHTKLKLTFLLLLGGPQNTIKSHLVFTALFCLAPFSVFLQSHERALLSIKTLTSKFGK
jgi:hypothetical protein